MRNYSARIQLRSISDMKPDTILSFDKEELESLLLATHLYYKECKLDVNLPAEVNELHREIAWKLYQKIKEAYEKTKGESEQ